MKVIFRDVDRRAVDLLLDRTAGEGQVTTFSPVDQHLSTRVPTIEKVLSLLEEMPAEDPPRDLVRRTLLRVGEFSGQELPIPKPVGERAPLA